MLIRAKDAARCEKYCDIAMTSEKEAKDALNLKLYVMKDGLKTKADSLAYVDKLKALFDKDQTNEVILDGLNVYVFFYEDGEGADGAFGWRYR